MASRISSAERRKREIFSKMHDALKLVKDKPGGTIVHVGVEKRHDKIIARMVVEKAVVFTLEGEVLDE